MGATKFKQPVLPHYPSSPAKDATTATGLWHNIDLQKSKQIYLADTLSRAPHNSTSQTESVDDDFEVMSVSYISNARLEELRAHTAKDQVLQTLCSIIYNGWPNKESQVSLSVLPFFPYRDELIVENGIVTKGHRTVIPDSLQQKYITIMHRGHPGLEATKCRAISTVFWPSMNKDITKDVLSCSVCNSTRPHQQKEPLKPHPVPTLPWSIVATDMFEWHGQQYMVLVDS